jgi:hypothetical protein
MHPAGSGNDGIRQREPRHNAVTWRRIVVRARSGIGSIVLVIWLLIGALAAGQRHYFSGSTKTCAKAGTTAVTILAGPLNYLGVNPKISCPKPSG